MTLTVSKIKIFTCPEDKNQKKLYDKQGLFLLAKNIYFENIKRKAEGKAELKNTDRMLWRFKYLYEGKHKEMALGKFKDVTLADARDKAKEARNLLTAGTDPMAKRKETRINSSDQSLNFGVIANNWIAANVAGWGDLHHRKYLRYIKNDYKELCKQQIQDITKEDIRIVIKASADQNYKRKARDLMSVLNQIFDYGNEEIDAFKISNPMSKLGCKILVGKLPRVKRYPAITDAKKLGKLIAKIDNNIKGIFCSQEALKLLPRIFLRPSELRLLKWEYVNFDEELIYVPKEIMKMRNDHIVPMSTQVIAQLEYIHERTNYSPYIFPSEMDSSKPFSKNVLNTRLNALGYTGDVMVAHGFRGTASTLLHEQGVESDHIEVQLAHDIGTDSSKAYNRAKFLTQRKKMMQEWSDRLENLRDVEMLEVALN
jgi:integrase